MTAREVALREATERVVRAAVAESAAEAPGERYSDEGAAEYSNRIIAARRTRRDAVRALLAAGWKGEGDAKQPA